MSDGRAYKVGIFNVQRAMEAGAGTHERTNFRSTRSSDYVSLPSPPLSPRVGTTLDRRLVAPMETLVGTQGSLSQQRCHNICPGAEAGSGVFTNRPAADCRLQSPTGFSSLYSSQASSRDSVFSEGWDRERSWSTMQLSNAMSPLSLSRAASPCSSVRSGAFTPTVVRVRRHTLAPGSSLLRMTEASCLSSCESLASSVGAQSPPPPPRHRPPLTRLSLLTAILRKGRLPVLSPTLRRPYSPCWPINHITLASCAACSAAASLAPLSPPPEPRSPPPVVPAADVPPAQNRSHWDSFKRRPGLPSMHIKDDYGLGHGVTETSDRNYHTGKEPKFQTVFSRPVKSPLVHRATGGGRGVTLPPQSPTSQLKAVTAHIVNPARPTEGTEGTHTARLQSHSSPGSPGTRQGANQTCHPRCPVTDYSQQVAQIKHKPSSPEAMGAGTISARRVCSPPPLPATARLDCVSPPPPRSLPSCLRKTPAFATHAHSRSAAVSEPSTYPVTKSPVLGDTSAVHRPTPPPDSPRDKSSSAPRSSSSTPTPTPTSSSSSSHCLLSPSRYTPIVFPGWPSPNSSRTSTPDCFTLTPSPASQAARDLTPTPTPTPCSSPSPSPSPSSLRSTPSPRPGSGKSEHTYRGGKKMKPHKIKSSYKSLAAIPTNTLLLDQQVIDEQVDEARGSGGAEDPHAEMCSPAQLRQESEELYAVIDKILEDAIPKSKTSSSSSRECSHSVAGLKPTQSNSLGRPLGRETKYATVSSPPPPPCSLERTPAETKTKPGVIRPVIAIPRLQVDDYAGEYRCNPFNRHQLDAPAARSPMPPSHSARTPRQDEARLGVTVSEYATVDESEEDGPPTSGLFIMESEDRRPRSVKPAAWHGASTTFTCAKVLPEVSETRI